MAISYHTGTTNSAPLPLIFCAYPSGDVKIQKLFFFFSRKFCLRFQAHHYSRTSCPFRVCESRILLSLSYIVHFDSLL